MADSFQDILDRLIKNWIKDNSFDDILSNGQNGDNTMTPEVDDDIINDSLNIIKTWFSLKEEIILEYDLKDIDNETDLYKKWIMLLFLIRANEINLMDDKLTHHERQKFISEIKKINKKIVEIITDDIKILAKKIAEWIKKSLNWAYKINNEVIDEVIDEISEPPIINFFDKIFFLSEFILFKINLSKNFFDKNKQDKTNPNIYKNFEYYIKFLEFQQWIFFIEKKYFNDLDKNLKKIFLKDNIKDIINTWKIENINEVKDDTIYFIVRYIKKIYKHNNVNKLDNLINIYKGYYSDIWENCATKLDHSYMIKKTNQIRFLNNIISLLFEIIENQPSNNIIKTLPNYLNFIKNECFENEWYETYFTYYKLAKLYYIISKKNLNYDNINFLKEANININNAIKKYNEVDWSHACFYCPIDVIIEKSNIFTFSSFMPLEKSDIYNKILNTQQEILKLELDKEFEIKTKKLEEKMEEVTKKDFKIVEILAIFSAIVLFVSSNIQLYQYLSSVKQVILFMLMFWTILIWFILLLHTIINNIFKKMFPYLIAYALIIAVWIWFLVFYKEDYLLINRKIVDEYIDLINSKINNYKSLNNIPSISTGQNNTTSTKDPQ